MSVVHQMQAAVIRATIDKALDGADLLIVRALTELPPENDAVHAAMLQPIAMVALAVRRMIESYPESAPMFTREFARVIEIVKLHPLTELFTEIREAKAKQAAEKAAGSEQAQ